MCYVRSQIEYPTAHFTGAAILGFDITLDLGLAHRMAFVVADTKKYTRVSLVHILPQKDEIFLRYCKQNVQCMGLYEQYGVVIG